MTVATVLRKSTKPRISVTGSLRVQARVHGYLFQLIGEWEEEHPRKIESLPVSDYPRLMVMGVNGRKDDYFWVEK